jgi:hypothetical protein
MDGEEKDLPPGAKLVACFRLLEALVASELSPKSIQKHVDNCGHWAGKSSET